MTTWHYIILCRFNAARNKRTTRAKSKPQGAQRGGTRSLESHCELIANSWLTPRGESDEKNVWSVDYLVCIVPLFCIGSTASTVLHIIRYEKSARSCVIQTCDLLCKYVRERKQRHTTHAVGSPYTAQIFPPKAGSHYS